MQSVILLVPICRKPAPAHGEASPGAGIICFSAWWLVTAVSVLEGVLIQTSGTARRARESSRDSRAVLN